MSAHYGGGLLPQHADLLNNSQIPPDLATVRGYVSVDTKARLTGLHITQAGRNIPGLLIPLLRMDGSTWGFQYRPDSPRRSKEGKAVKYETPVGQTNGLDIPPGVGPKLGDPTIPLFITEGTRKADSAAALGLACIALLGVYGWRGTNTKRGKTALADWQDIALNGRRVILAFDSDVMVKAQVRQALEELATYLATKDAVVEYLHLPHSDNVKTGLDDWLVNGGTVDELWRLVRPDMPTPIDIADPDGDDVPAPSPSLSQVVPPMARDKAIAVFRQYLHLPDLDPLLVVAASAVANLSPERSPLWLLVIGPPSSGKTEIISGLTRLPNAVYAATLTESALLSGTSKSERAKDATGGLLRRIPNPGILVMKDFGSVLAQNRDARASALAALREVYDGSWTRAVGTDGGKLLEWSGKVGLIAGGTPSYDKHHGVIAALGDRFLLVRLADLEHEASGMAALTHAGREGRMRKDLDEALAGLVMSADMSLVKTLTDAEKLELVRLARYTGTARTGIERDGYTGELLVMPEPEGPGRLVVALNQLMAGLWSIGCDDPTAWRIVRRVARDTVPALRTAVLKVLVGLTEPERTADIASRVGLVTKSAHRILDDLSLVGLVTRTKTGTADNAPDHWQASPLLRDLWPSETEMYVSKDTAVVDGKERPSNTKYTVTYISVPPKPDEPEDTTCPHGVLDGDKPDSFTKTRARCTQCAMAATA